MPERRQPLPPKLRASILERDGNRCRKCGRESSLEVHHIVMVVNGGGDEPDNLIVLCSPCHGEWHAIDDWYEFSFDTWLTLPPLMTLIGMLAIEWPRDESAREWQDTIRAAGLWQRHIRHSIDPDIAAEYWRAAPKYPDYSS